MVTILFVFNVAVGTLIASLAGLTFGEIQGHFGFSWLAGKLISARARRLRAFSRRSPTRRSPLFRG